MAIENTTQTLENHIVILGWSNRVQRIIAQLRDDRNFSPDAFEPILVVSPESDIPNLQDIARVYFILGKLTDLKTLKRANIEKAKVVLIPSNLPEHTNTDGNSVLALLSTLSIDANLRVCVEVAGSDNGTTLEHIRSKNLISSSVEIISFESVSERLLAQAAINKGITKVYDHLLSFDDTNELYTLDLPTTWIGKTFRELSHHCFNLSVLLIGYENEAGLAINPVDRDYIFVGGDRCWFIAYDREAVETVLGVSEE